MNYLFKLLVLICFIGTGCNTAGRLRKECARGRDASAPAIVLTKSGELLKGNKLKETKTEHNLDGKIIPNDEVIASQANSSDYYKKQGNLWHRRIRAGKINFYYVTNYITGVNTNTGMQSSRTNYNFYLEKGNAEMESFSIKRLREMVSDNQQAADYMLKIYPSTTKEYYNTSYLKMLKVIDYYNAL
jgi:hypothetical protein